LQRTLLDFLLSDVVGFGRVPLDADGRRLRDGEDDPTRILQDVAAPIP